MTIPSAITDMGQALEQRIFETVKLLAFWSMLAIGVWVWVWLTRTMFGNKPRLRWRGPSAGATILDWLALYAMHVLMLGLVFSLITQLNVLPPGFSEAEQTSIGAIHGGVAIGVESVVERKLTQVRMMLASILVLPAFLLLTRSYLRVVHGHDWQAGFLPRGEDLLATAKMFTYLVPVVFVVYLVAVLIVQALGGDLETHSLTNFALRSTSLERLLMVLTACLLTPILEEVLFRGLLLRWASATHFNALSVGMVAFLLAVLLRLGESVHWPSLAFAGIIGLALFQLPRLRGTGKFPQRTIQGVVATSLLFAVAHSTVWPTPLPLFVLGCGLAILVSRTGRLFGAIVVHGLFNLISTLYLFV
ncbi:MAG: lysostaphin resistance A-like protein [Fimbriiglobus sp.]